MKKPTKKPESTDTTVTLSPVELQILRRALGEAWSQTSFLNEFGYTEVDNLQTKIYRLEQLASMKKYTGKRLA